MFWEDLISCDLSYKVHILNFHDGYLMRGRKSLQAHTLLSSPKFLLLFYHICEKIQNELFGQPKRTRREKISLSFRILKFSVTGLQPFKLLPRVYIHLEWNYGHFSYKLIWIFFLDILNENFQIANIFSFFPIFFLEGAIQEKWEKRSYSTLGHIWICHRESYAYFNWICISCGSQFGRQILLLSHLGNPSAIHDEVLIISWKVSGFFCLSFCFFKIHESLSFFH